MLTSMLAPICTIALLQSASPPSTPQPWLTALAQVAFWLSAALIAYAYLGYPLYLQFFTRKRSVTKTYITPTVSILIAARNEEANLPRKLENLRGLDYPQHRVQIIIVSDHSTDRTAAILQATPGIHAIVRPSSPPHSADSGTSGSPPTGPLDTSRATASSGKASALNEAVLHATGEILVFLDTRQSVDSSALAALVAPFADPTVGAVSGELLLEPARPLALPPSGTEDSPPAPASPNALGLYWKIEKAVRKLESGSGSVIGVTGAIYAIRRELYTPLPPGTILDDVFIPMHVVRAGKRVIFEPSAIARDRIFATPGKEFSRKVRTLTGNYQLLRLAPWLLSPQNPLLFRFLSHKLIRLLVPFLLLLALVTSAALAAKPFYLVLFLLQLAFYAMAATGTLAPATTRLKPVSIATTFFMLNAAAAYALYNFLRNHTEVWS
jgi:cellulose synthase/poly-beta-1,6-N-acetylglucosamine synthase-like glycosyltransferase